MKKVILSVLLLSLCLVLYSEAVPVEILSNAEDTNGQRLITKLRDVIRESLSYDLTYSDKQPHFVIKIDTMDRFKGDYYSEGNSTIYSYAILLNMGNGLQLYMDSRLGYAGKNTLNDVAENIYSDMDNYIETFKKIVLQYLDE